MSRYISSTHKFIIFFYFYFKLLKTKMNLCYCFLHLRRICSLFELFYYYFISFLFDYFDIFFNSYCFFNNFCDNYVWMYWFLNFNCVLKGILKYLHGWFFLRLLALNPCCQEKTLQLVNHYDQEGRFWILIVILLYLLFFLPKLFAYFFFFINVF